MRAVVHAVVEHADGFVTHVRQHVIQSGDVRVEVAPQGLVPLKGSKAHRTRIVGELVSADVKGTAILVIEPLGVLLHHGKAEGGGVGIGDIQGAVAAGITEINGLAGLRILHAGQHRAEVAGAVQQGDDLDAVLVGMRDDIGHLSLGEVLAFLKGAVQVDGLFHRGVPGLKLHHIAAGHADGLVLERDLFHQSLHLVGGLLGGVSGLLSGVSRLLGGVGGLLSGVSGLLGGVGGLLSGVSGLLGVGGLLQRLLLDGHYFGYRGIIGDVHVVQLEPDLAGLTVAEVQFQLVVTIQGHLVDQVHDPVRGEILPPHVQMDDPGLGVAAAVCILCRRHAGRDHAQEHCQAEEQREHARGALFHDSSHHDSSSSSFVMWGFSLAREAFSSRGEKKRRPCKSLF